MLDARRRRRFPLARTARRLFALLLASWLAWRCGSFLASSVAVPDVHARPQRPLLRVWEPPPAPDDAAARAWRQRNEILDERFVLT